MTVVFGLSFDAPAGFPWVLIGLGGLTALVGWLTWRAAFPTPVPLPVARSRIAGRGPVTTTVVTETRIKQRLGTWAVPYAEYCGLNPADVRADARMLDLSLAEHLGSKITSIAILGMFIVVGAGLLTIAGAAPPVGAVLVVLAAAVLIGLFLPDVLLHRNAGTRRAEFEVAMGTYLDLVAIGLSGGMGIEGAMREASVIGNNWAFAELAHAVEAANMAGTIIADRLAELGRELRVSALVELAAAMELAGTDGARVADTVATKADTMRLNQLAAIDARAQNSTERLAVPMAMLLFGFVILIGYPAVAAILNGF